jgi:hypothetical protein
MVSTVSGPDYCVGVQSGGLFPKEVNQFLPVVRIFDPFAGVRRPVREPELPEALDHLATAAEAICEARESRPRTTILCASGNRVISALQDRGMPANQARDALAMLRNLGVIDRKEWVKDSLALSAAGEAWVQALRTAAENDSDIPVEELVANAVRTVFREFDGPPSRVSSWDLEDWVSHVVQQFKLAVANTGLVRALWTPSGAPQDERGVQSVLQAFLHQTCRISNVDLSKEVDAGNGPVDFKLSIGSTSTLVEVKLLGNPRLRHGARRQLPRYLQGENALCGFLLCVGFTDKDFDPDRIERVRQDCSETSRDWDLRVRPIFVDARRRPSASRW